MDVWLYIIWAYLGLHSSYLSLENPSISLYYKTLHSLLHVYARIASTIYNPNNIGPYVCLGTPYVSLVRFE